MKYWDTRRVKRVRERERARERTREAAGIALAAATLERQRSYSAGATAKNTSLMLDALGNRDRRRMVARLRTGGAMSLSKLASPFRIKLPTAHAHLKVLERSGIVKTHKRGRVRICVYNPLALKELVRALASGFLHDGAVYFSDH